MSEKPPEAQPQKGTGASHPAWIVGGVLIAVGVIFIIRNVSGVTFDNWWALFILIPGLGSLATAYRMWDRAGRRLTAAARGPLIVGLILLAVTAVFVFELDWGKVWPAFLILIGLGVLLSSFQRRG
jgi:hypothetical protein